MKTILYRLFGVGKIPAFLLDGLKGERVVESDEGVRSTITYRNFRAPGRYSNWKRTWLTGALLLTDKRLILLKYSTPVVNIPLTNARFSEMRISTEDADAVLLFAFEPHLFLENSSGEIEWRFHTAQAQKIADALNRRTE